MNVTDIKTEAPDLVLDGARIADMLQLMMSRQNELENKYEDIERANGFWVPATRAEGLPLDIDDHRAQLFLKDAAYRVVEELSEATNCLKNKPWKTTQVLTDQTHFIEELADATHFFIRMWLYIYGTPEAAAEAMFKMYFKKSEVNKFRQASDY